MVVCVSSRSEPAPILRGDRRSRVPRPGWTEVTVTSHFARSVGYTDSRHETGGESMGSVSDAMLLAAEAGVRTFPP